MPAADHFSASAGLYRTYRPTYPPSLFEALSRLPARRQLAWDCACGSGQASAGLARHFETVIATDLSEPQLERAKRSPSIYYVTSLAEAAPVAAGQADLVCVAQALHWFDLPRFYGEVDRVLRKDGYIAAWCYGRAKINAGVDNIVEAFYRDTIGPYWPPERAHIETGYAELPFPFQPVDVQAGAMSVRWSANQFCGYLRSWSASQRYQDHRGVDPVSEIEPLIDAAWGGVTSDVRWPLTVLAGRNA